MPVIPAMQEAYIARKHRSKASQGQKSKGHSMKNKLKAKKTGGMAQVVEHLPS
jgi:hypothetical protein